MENSDSSLEFTRVHLLDDIVNKKKLLERLSELLSQDSGLSFHRILDGLTAREKIGPTCIGKGVAIPHCKLKIEQPKICVLRLDEAIKYSDNNQQTVDIIFALMIPAENCQQHLHLLSSIAKLCDNDEWLAELRQVESSEEVYKMISDAQPELGKLL